MGDVIYRDDAIAFINSGISLDTNADREYAIDMFKAIPPVDVVSLEDAMQIRNTILFKEYMRGRRDAEVEQGEWICKGDYAICSKCGSSSGTQFDGVERTPRTTAFCPHCGRRMKGAEHEID